MKNGLNRVKNRERFTAFLTRVETDSELIRGEGKMPKWIRNLSLRTVIYFVATFILCLLATTAILLNQNQLERLTKERLIVENSKRIEESISRLFFRTQTLASFIHRYDGELAYFDSIATVILDDPAILNVLVAPKGIVSNVYPLYGNEAVLGWDFFAENQGNREAVLAKESKELVLGGPFHGVQDEQILVGRLPVFLDSVNDCDDKFWGIVSVTLRFPEALEHARLSELQTLGFEYEIWRVNPDTNENQIIASSETIDNFNATHYVERPLSFLNAEWNFKILTNRHWYLTPITWVLLVVSLIFSTLVAAISYNYQELKKLKNKLEILSNVDPLTEIYNRRYFLKTVTNQMIRITRIKSESYIIIFDVDHFKNINDKHGHQVGDTVLQEITKRVVATLRPYDIFARYGGEEFIIFVTEVNKETAIALSERLRNIIAKTTVNIKNKELSVTASFGIAQAAPVNDLNEAISLADKALYKAKEDGRNRVCFY